MKDRKMIELCQLYILRIGILVIHLAGEIIVLVSICPVCDLSNPDISISWATSCRCSKKYCYGVCRWRDTCSGDSEKV
jgi:hypothetical protein